MTQEPRLYNSVAPLGNVVAMVELILRVQNRTQGLPGMACYFGPSGLGKSTAAIYACNKFKAHLVQINSQCTRRYLVEQIMAELGLTAPRAMTIPRMVDAVSEYLGRTGEPLLIDEADTLVDRGMIEIARDIYEGSGVPVILIGEEDLPKKLELHERIHGRMLDWVGAQPATMDDVQHLAPIYCRGLTLDAPMLTAVLEASRNSIRRICNNLDRVREFAANKGLKSVTVADWGDQPFCAAAAPGNRRIKV
jgi:DNA transposition AAA+ family ATPase